MNGRGRSRGPLNVRPDAAATLPRRPASPPPPPPPATDDAPAVGASNQQVALEAPSAAAPSSATNSAASRAHRAPTLRTRPADNFDKLGNPFFFFYNFFSTILIGFLCIKVHLESRGWSPRTILSWSVGPTFTCCSTGWIFLPRLSTKVCVRPSSAFTRVFSASTCSTAPCCTTRIVSNRRYNCFHFFFSF